jgi:hypothetical protein
LSTIEENSKDSGLISLATEEDEDKELPGNKVRLKI